MKEVTMGCKVRLVEGGPEMEVTSITYIADTAKWGRDENNRFTMLYPGTPTVATCKWKIDRELHMFDYPVERLEVIQ